MPALAIGSAGTALQALRFIFAEQRKGANRCLIAICALGIIYYEALLERAFFGLCHVYDEVVLLAFLHQDVLVVE